MDERVALARLNALRRLLAVALCLLAAVFSTARADVPATPAGWQLMFSDDFDGDTNTLPSPVKWRFLQGHNYVGGQENWGTREIQTYTNDPANISVTGTGLLRITPQLTSPDHWTSARMESNIDTFGAPENGMMHVEARIRLPDIVQGEALGYWPAFWMLGAPFRDTGEWPSVGELDIMENVNGLDFASAVLHCGVSPGGPCNEPSGIGAFAPCPHESCQSSFHTYAVEWDRSVSPAQLRWYVDGQLWLRVLESDLPADTWAAMSQHRGYFLLLNVAMGGSYPDALSTVKTPILGTAPGYSMLVDYIAVWTREGNSAPMLSPFVHH